jgi:hypothetical protein
VQEAEELYRRTLSARRRVLGELHPDFLASLSVLAEWLRSQRRFDEAEPLARELLEHTPEGHPDASRRRGLLDAIVAGRESDAAKDRSADR